MAVTESNKIDGIAIGDDNKTLIMLITDHLDWDTEFEFDHLTILQEKINSYLGFIESKQYMEIYPDNVFYKFLIEISFLHEITDNCIKYIDNANRQLTGTDIEIVFSVSEK